MAQDLVRYVDGKPVFTDVVSDFAAALHPLLGFATLAAKVHAWRIETKRLKLEESRAAHEHRERMQINSLEAAAHDRREGRLAKFDLEMLMAKREVVRSLEQASARNFEIALRENDAQILRIERGFEATIHSIDVWGDAARREVDQFAAAKFAEIDALLQTSLQALAIERHRIDLNFKVQARKARTFDRSANEIQGALRAATGLMVKDSGMREIAALSVGTLGNALALMHQSDHGPQAALLSALGHLETH